MPGLQDKGRRAHRGASLAPYFLLHIAALVPTEFCITCLLLHLAVVQDTCVKCKVRRRRGRPMGSKDKKQRVRRSLSTGGRFVLSTSESPKCSFTRASLSHTSLSVQTILLLNHTHTRCTHSGDFLGWQEDRPDSRGCQGMR
jgi:hypothetical protein